MPKGPELFADVLIEAGIDHVFGIPGGSTLFIFDALEGKKDKIRVVLGRHEGSASCMADMYGRMTGKPGVLIGQGPWIGSSGALGILEAFYAGSPMLIVTDFSDYASLTQHGVYQNSSGDYGAADLVAMMRSMTKFTTVATNASEFIHGVRLAIKHAITGRPGPACVIVRWNVITEEANTDTIFPKLYPLAGHLTVSPPSIGPDDATKAADLLLSAKSPVMICGRGVHVGRAHEAVRAMAELIGIPVATSYMGKSAIAETHDLALGTMGILGQKAANDRITGADLLLVVGSCLAPENTKMMSADFIKPDRQKIIQIDIEPLNVGWTYPTVLGITSDARIALEMIIDRIKKSKEKIDAGARISEIKQFKETRNFFTNDMFTSDSVPVMPGRIVREINDLIGNDDILVLDTGNNRIFFANLFKSKGAGQVFAGGGVAGMGWGVAAAVAAQILNPGKRVVCPTGDGCMMMMLNCLETASQYELPVTYVVLNNSVLGNVNDFMAPDHREVTTYRQPDLSGAAKSLGCVGIKVKTAADLKPALKEAMASGRPSLVDVTTAHIPHFGLMSF
ncbi:MAG: thiamine pyrophosphate-binding protein [Deltaproteobacteria bacterium]|nr:thiamine pyrophosphate-binding protein [Candidatus Zymogenaceae bacterium]